MDDFSRYVWIYLIPEKKEASNLLKIFVNMIQTQFHKIIKSVRTDNITGLFVLRNNLLKKEFYIKLWLRGPLYKMEESNESIVTSLMWHVPCIFKLIYQKDFVGNVY